MMAAMDKVEIFGSNINLIAWEGYTSDDTSCERLYCVTDLFILFCMIASYNVQILCYNTCTHLKALCYIYQRYANRQIVSYNHKNYHTAKTVSMIGKKQMYNFEINFAGLFYKRQSRWA